MLPFTIVKFSDTWCPSTFHPQLPFALGVPNTQTKYYKGFRSSFGGLEPGGFSIAFRIVSSSMIDVVVM